MKNLIIYISFPLLFLSLIGCSSDNNDYNVEKGKVPLSAHLLPITKEPIEKTTLPSSNEEVTMKVLFDVEDILSYNIQTGEIIFKHSYTIEQLHEKGYISMIGENDCKYQTFVFTNLSYSQIVNYPVLYQNNLYNNKYYLVRGYPFWTELEKEQQAERNKKLEEILPSWFELLDKLKAQDKIK